VTRNDIPAGHLACTVFAVLDIPLDDLLQHRFATFRTIYLPAVAHLTKHGFELLATGRRPHFTVQLRRADDQELAQLLTALSAPQPNPQYARSTVWGKED
jgi:hypothetical protein